MKLESSKEERMMSELLAALLMFMWIERVTGRWPMVCLLRQGKLFRDCVPRYSPNCDHSRALKKVIGCSDHAWWPRRVERLRSSNNAR